MYTMIRYANGRRVEGIILSASPDSLRVVLRQQGDTTELRRVFGEWTAEDGSAVEVESMLADDTTDLLCYTWELTQHTHTAN